LSFVLALALALQPFDAARENPRVIVVSFDGAGYAMTSRLLAEGKLPSFDRMLRGGAWSDGMVTSFPTKTAAAHALLFTGQHGHTSGITANSVLRFPPSAGSRLETLNGFFSDSLRAEPVWARAAALGLETYVFHAPQVYPFRPQPHLNIVYGYSDATSRGEVLAPSAVVGAEAREIRFAVGESRYRGVFFDDPDDPTVGCDSLEIAVEPELGAFVARLKPGDAGSFSVPIAASLEGRSTWFSLRLFTLSSDAVFACGGTIDKFIGDAVMAFFGAPLDQPDHAVRAVAAALKIREAMCEWNKERTGRGDPPLEVRIAVNTGEAIVGDIGSERRVDYTVLGNAVNVAARLEEFVAQPGDIVIGPETWEGVRDRFEVAQLGFFALKGLSTQVPLYKVLSARDPG